MKFAPRDRKNCRSPIWGTRNSARDLHASPQWKEAVERNGWTDAYLSGDQYAAFITEQDAEVGGVLTDLGL